jgi:hypothetical protein
MNWKFVVIVSLVILVLTVVDVVRSRKRSADVREIEED